MHMIDLDLFDLFTYPGPLRRFLRIRRIAVGIGLNAADQQEARAELTQMCANALDDGLTILARDIRTGQIVGIMLNNLQVQADEPSFFETFRNNACKTAVAREYLRIVIELSASVDMHAIHATDVLLDMMVLAVSQAYARRSIGRKLIEYTLHLSSQLKAGLGLERLPQRLRSPVQRLGCVTSLFTSNYSMAIGVRLGFQLHHTILYERISYAGKTMQNRQLDPTQRSMRQVSLAI